MTDLKTFAITFTLYYIKRNNDIFYIHQKFWVIEPTKQPSVEGTIPSVPFDPVVASIFLANHLCNIGTLQYVKKCMVDKACCKRIFVVSVYIPQKAKKNVTSQRQYEENLIKGNLHWPSSWIQRHCVDQRK